VSTSLISKIGKKSSKIINYFRSFGYVSQWKYQSRHWKTSNSCFSGSSCKL